MRRGDRRRGQSPVGQVRADVLLDAQDERPVQRCGGELAVGDVGGDERSEQVDARPGDEGGGRWVVEDVGAPERVEVRGHDGGERVVVRTDPQPGHGGERPLRERERAAGHLEVVQLRAVGVEHRVRAGALVDHHVARTQHGLVLALRDHRRARDLHREEDRRVVVLPRQGGGPPQHRRCRPGGREVHRPRLRDLAEHLDLRSRPVVVDLDRQHPGPDGVVDDLDAVVGRQVVGAQDQAHTGTSQVGRLGCEQPYGRRPASGTCRLTTDRAQPDQIRARRGHRPRRARPETEPHPQSPERNRP